MTTHDLKCWPEPFAAILDGTKTYEIRSADRAFSVGDLLRLREWRPFGVHGDGDIFPLGADGVTPEMIERRYTGREVTRLVTYMTAPEQWGLPSGLCVLALATPPPPVTDAGPLKCGTFSKDPIPPEVRARMDADRKAAEDGPVTDAGRCPVVSSPVVHAGWCAKNNTGTTLVSADCNCACGTGLSPGQGAT